MAPLDTESGDKPLTKSGKKREATKAALVDALEGIIAEEGIAAAGVNAVAKRAGVGKPLIYKYFGGFDGLVQAWASQSKVWGDDEDIFSVLAKAPDADPAPLIRDYFVQSATDLRGKTVALEVMAHALLGENPLSEGLKSAKGDSGKHHDTLFQKGGVFDDPDMTALLMIMFAASRYLALRSLSQSNYNGIDLKTENGWKTIMTMMSRVFDNALEGAKTR